MEARRPGKRTTRGIAIAVVALVSISALAVSLGGCSVIRAARILDDALDPPAALAGRVGQRVVSVDGADGATRMYVLRPRNADGPLPALLLVHGATVHGPDDPRFMGLALALAAHGATVAAPDLVALRELRLDTGDVTRVRDAALWLAGRPDLAAGGRVALLAISVGGSYALLAAADPALSPRLSAVLAFGAYDDLEQLLLQWTTQPVATPELLDPLTEGRRRVLRGNLDALLHEEGHRARVERALTDLLDGWTTPADVARLAADETLDERAAIVLEAAASDDPIDADAAHRLLAPLAAICRALSPAPLDTLAPTTPLAALPREVPVFLLHGAGDPVVPPADSERLAALLTELGHAPRLHVTAVFGHVDAEPPSWLRSWSLLRFVAGFLDAAGM